MMMTMCQFTLMMSIDMWSLPVDVHPHGIVFFGWDLLACSPVVLYHVPAWKIYSWTCGSLIGRVTVQPCVHGFGNIPRSFEKNHWHTFKKNTTNPTQIPKQSNTFQYKTISKISKNQIHSIFTTPQETLAHIPKNPQQIQNIPNYSKRANHSSTFEKIQTSKKSKTFENQIAF